MKKTIALVILFATSGAARTEACIYCTLDKQNIKYTYNNNYACKWKKTKHVFSAAEDFLLYPIEKLENLILKSKNVLSESLGVTKEAYKIALWGLVVAGAVYGVDKALQILEQRETFSTINSICSFEKLKSHFLEIITCENINKKIYTAPTTFGKVATEIEKFFKPYLKKLINIPSVVENAYENLKNIDPQKINSFLGKTFNYFLFGSIATARLEYKKKQERNFNGYAEIIEN